MQCSSNHLYLVLISRRPPNECKLDFKKMKQRMNQVKNKSYPRIPKTALEIQNFFRVPANIDEHCSTMDTASSLYVDTIVTADYAFTVFASHAIINIVRRNIDPNERNYLIDGTFKVVPKVFYQLITISIEYKNDVSFHLHSF